MNKQKRQFTIREILAKEHIGSHEELAHALRRVGFPTTTQTTVSRDLAEMGIGRLVTKEGPRYVANGEGEDSRIRALMSYEVTSIQHSDSMIVIKTLAGRAHGVAEAIDSMRSPHILGTIAGDNTIFVAPKNAKEINRLVKELRAFIISE
jgi:transcriptional regulator of arginine metabolism